MRSKDWQARLRLHNFRVEEARRQVGEIELMIGEFRRKQDDLEAGIRFEEERTGISDPAHVQYPPAALDMRNRRDNLLKSISDLDSQLEAAVQRAREAEDEFEKVRLLAEKTTGESFLPASGSAASPMERRIA